MALSGPESRFAQNYPSDWRERRKRVFERDGYRCGNCRAEGGPDGHATLHCHHIVPISAGESHHETNLTTVCEVCHKKIHGVRTTSHIPATYRVEYEFSGDYLPATTDDGGDGGEDDVDGESDRAGGRRKQGRDRGQWRQ